MNDANDHSFDFGQAGLEQTIAALHRAGIVQDGLPGEITVVKAGGEKVAFVGFAPYSNTASLRLVEAGQPMPDPSGEGTRLIRTLSCQDLGEAAARIGGKGHILGTVGGV